MNQKRFGTIASIAGLVAIMAVMIIAGAAVQGQAAASSQPASAGNIETLLNGHHSPGKSKSASHPATSAGMPRVQGDQILDGSGHPLLLRGAQIESALNNIQRYKGGEPISRYLNPGVFAAMVQQWHMNALRLPISNWVYETAPSQYLSQLDLVIQQANAAGLYVILDLHDDAKGGSPYADNAQGPKVQSVAFWHTIAARYKNYSMVMFDPFNEPKVVGWQTWLHGGGTMAGAQLVGFQDLVNAIRAVGAQQIIIVEPGRAGGTGLQTQDKGWATIGSDTINDPNIVYSLHVYEDITLSAQLQDAKWGPILYHHPIYYGEWALTTNGYGQDGYDHCKNIDHAQADQIVTNFLNYMTSRHANWTAWQFEPNHLIQSETTFAPTTLDIPWTCGNPDGTAGMGSLVKQFLTSGQ